MASDKNQDGDELAKSSAVECEVANKLLSLVDANTSNHNLTLEENKRILRKLDIWFVFLLLVAWLLSLRRI